MNLVERRALGDRINAMVSVLGSAAAAARVADLSPDQLSRITSGASAASALALWRLADASGHSLDWVMSGRGPTRRDASSVGAPAPEGAREPRRFEQTKNKVLVAEGLGQVLEELYAVKELPEAVENDIGELAELIVDATRGDDNARRALVQQIIALLRALRRL